MEFNRVDVFYIKQVRSSSLQRHEEDQLKTSKNYLTQNINFQSQVWKHENNKVEYWRPSSRLKVNGNDLNTSCTRPDQF